MLDATCPQCQCQVRVDPARIPAGKAVRIACPSCQQPFPFGPVTAQAPTPAASTSTSTAAATSTTSTTSTTSYAAAMAAADEERLVTRITETVLATLLPLLGKSGAPGTAAAAAAAAANTGSDDPEWVDVDSRAALVCDPDPSFAAQAAEALRDLGYVPQVAPDLRTAWKLLDKHFAVVAVSDALADDPQGGAKVLDRLSRLPGPKRRAMFVALVSPDVQTMDGGLAFVSNANMTIARADAAQLRDVLRKGLRDRDKMYRPFLAALEAAAGSH